MLYFYDEFKMKIILHMPHTSLKVPRNFFKGLKIEKSLFNKYNLLMSDIGVDLLFSDIKAKRIKAKYSRLYCDVERFADDAKEEMSKFGQGVIYTHTYDGKEFHKHDDFYRKKVLKYYYRYHKNFDRMVTNALKRDNELCIIDCHSFSDKMASMHSEQPFPDICIGLNDGYQNEELVNCIIKKIEERGYTYKINYPYKGSIIPNCVLENKVKGNVYTIMIEINKRIYLV